MKERAGLVISYIQKLKALFHAYVEPEMTTRLFDLAAIVSRVSLALSIFYPRCHPSKKRKLLSWSLEGSIREACARMQPSCD
jgi:hypothetical protein